MSPGDRRTRREWPLRRVVVMAAMAGAVFAAPGCGTGGLAERWTQEERALLATLLLPENPTLPADPTNAVADDPAAAELGQRLFFDRSLSIGGDVSCASCHRPERAFTDGLPTAQGTSFGTRNTPTVLGSAFVPFVTWDGGRDSQWAQALGPLENPVEHGFTRVRVVRVVSERHRDAYEALFGALPPVSDTTRFPPDARPDPAFADAPHHVAWMAMAQADRDAIDRAFSNTGKALAAYQRRLPLNRAPFDDYVAAMLSGADSLTAPEAAAISDEALDGLALFIGKAGCVTCHFGPRLTNDSFHNLSVPPGMEGDPDDRGRLVGARTVLDDPFNCLGEWSDDRSGCAHLRFLDPLAPDVIGSFRTPSLRNVALTSPYMHSGQLPTLEAVVDFYADLPGRARLGHRDETLQPLDLSPADRRNLVAFLRILDGRPPPDALVRPLE